MTNIRVELQLEDGSFTTGVLRAGQSLSAFKQELIRTNRHYADLDASNKGAFKSFKRLEESSDGLLRKMRDISIVAGGLSLAFAALSGSSSTMVGNLVKINSEMEKLRYEMAGMSDAADPMADAVEQVDKLQELATKAPFSLGALSTAFVKLKAAGIDPNTGALKALTDGLAAFGASDDQLNRIVLGLSQMSGKGVIQMEELRQQLGESMPTAMKMMARSMGVSIGELTKAISTGRVEAGASLKLFFDEVERSYGGTGERMMKTFSGQMTRIKTELTRLVTGEGTGMRAAFEKLKEVMGGLADNLSTDDAQAFFDEMGNGLKSLLNGFQAVGRFIWEFRDTILNMAKAIAAAFAFIAVSAGFRALKSSILLLTADLMGVGVAAKKSKGELTALFETKRAAELRNAISGMSVSAMNLPVVGPMSALGDKPSKVGQALSGVMSRVNTKLGVTGKLLSTAGSAMGIFWTFGSKLLGVLGPVGLLLGTFGPLLWEGGKALYSWVTGAEKARDSIADLKRETLEANLAALEADKIKMDRLKAHYDKVPDTYEGFLAANKGANSVQLGVRAGKWRAELAAKQEFLAQNQIFNDAYLKAESELQVGITKVEDQEREKRVAAQLKALDDQFEGKTAEARQKYRKDTEDAALRQAEATKKARQAGKSGRAEQEAYQADLRKATQDQLESLIAIKEQQIANAEAGLKAGTIEAETVQKLNEELDKYKQQLADAGNIKFAIPTLLAKESDEKKMKRLERTFNSAKDKVNELAAELNGASGALAKLVYQMERGDFGNLEDANDVVRQMRDELIQTTIAAETLDRSMKKINAAQSEIDRIKNNTMEEIYKNRAILDGVDPEKNFGADFFKWKLDNGLIDGMGKNAEETLNKNLQAVTSGVDLSAQQFKTLGETMRTQTFGNATQEAISKVATLLERVQTAATGIKGMITGLSFQGFFGGASDYAGAIGSGPARNFLDMVAKAEGTDFKKGAKGYNTTLDYDKWTGPLDLVNMSLSQVLEVQKTMIAQNKGVYSDGKGNFGSSALGRYQIVSSTLKDAIEALGLDLNQKFDQNTQDQIALWIAKRSQGTAGGAGAPWQGITNKGLNAQAAAAFSSINPAELMGTSTGQVVSAVVNADAKVRETTDQTLALQAEAEDTKRRADLKQKEDELARELKAIGLEGELGKYGTKERGVREAILGGKLGSGSTDVSAKEYETALANAKAVDDANKKITEQRKADTEIQTQAEKLERQRLEIAERRKTALEQTKNPNYKGMSDDLRKLNDQERETLAQIEKAYGKGKAYKDMQDAFAQQRKAMMGAEGAEALRDLTRAAEESKRSAMSERQRRQDEYDRRVTELMTLKELAIRNGEDVAKAEMLFNQAVAAERKRLLDEYSGGLATTLEQMGQLGDNINAHASEWARTFSDGLYESMNLKGGFSAMINKIREDVARALTDKASSIILKPFESMLSGENGIGSMLEKTINGAFDPEKMKGMFSGLQDVFKGLFKWIGGLFSSMFNKSGTVGVKHSGGVIGHGGGWSRSVSAANFLGAPKFHVGGIVGKGNFRTGLNPSEVPIIAQKGEGIFTPDQMKHLGGTVSSQAISIAPTINVNASGGTPEANQDLAKQVARETEASMRALVQQELVRQMRPGGMMR